jgi:hypothetical protein
VKAAGLLAGHAVDYRPPSVARGKRFTCRSGQAATAAGVWRGDSTRAEGSARVGIDVALRDGMRTTNSFDLWSTEQVLLVYERYFGKLDPKARRRIVEDARLNGWDRTWGDGIELLAA